MGLMSRLIVALSLLPAANAFGNVPREMSVQAGGWCVLPPHMDETEFCHEGVSAGSAEECMALCKPMHSNMVCAEHRVETNGNKCCCVTDYMNRYPEGYCFYEDQEATTMVKNFHYLSACPDTSCMDACEDESLCGPDGIANSCHTCSAAEFMDITNYICPREWRRNLRADKSAVSNSKASSKLLRTTSHLKEVSKA